MSDASRACGRCGSSGRSASLGASAEQEPAPRSSTPSNTSLPSDQRAKVAGTPVKPTISSTGYHTGIAITGSEGATELRRDQYAREMNMKCAELDLEDFLSKFMPVGVNGDIPPSLVDNLPSFDRKVLLGTAENPICEALVRSPIELVSTNIVSDDRVISVRSIPENI